MKNSALFIFVCFTTIELIYGAAVANKQIARFSKEVNDHVCPIAKKCGGDSTKGYLQLMEEGKYKTDDHFKGFVQCFIKDGGYVNEDGKVNLELVASLYPDPAIALKVLQDCSKTAKVNYDIFTCFMDVSPYTIGLECF